MPSPSKGESRSAFIDRCMSDSEAKRDFPDNRQRLAFCSSQWERRASGRLHERKKKSPQPR